LTRFRISIKGFSSNGLNLDSITASLFREYFFYILYALNILF